MMIGWRHAVVLLLMIACFSAPSRAADALYDQLGGRDGISRIVSDTLDRAAKDDRIKAEFQDINMERLKRMVTDYVCQVAGGPCVYKGHDMKTVHRGVHASESDFNAFVEDMQDAMDDSSISFRTQNRLLALLAPVEHDVVPE